MDFAPMVVFATLVVKLIDFLSYLTNRKWKEALTQAITWTAGAALTFLVADTSFASMILKEIDLGALGVSDKVFIGLGLASAGSFLYDGKKAVDGSDSAVTPSLVP